MNQTYARDVGRCPPVMSRAEETVAFGRLAAAEARLILASAEHSPAQPPPDAVGPRGVGWATKVRYTEPGRKWADRVMADAFGKKGTRAARAAFDREVEFCVTSNLKLVMAVVNSIKRRRTVSSDDDLIQDGNIGLIKAACRFDPGLGNRFSTYATWWIRHHVIRSIEDRDALIRVPVKAAMLLRYAPAGAEQGKYSDFAAAAGRVTSLEEQMYGVDGLRLEDVLPADGLNPLEAVLEKGVAAELRAAVESDLTEFESAVIKKRFGLGVREMTLQEVGDERSLSRERIRQIEAVALRKLRRRFAGKPDTA